MTSRAHIAEIFVRALYPLLLICSILFLFRGHNAPGGGFIAGLIAVAASASYALVFSSVKAQKMMPLEPLRLTGLGILLALMSGLPATIDGLTFLSHPWWTLSFGVFEFSVSTVMLFDLGVYLAVWGTFGGLCTMMINSIEEDV